MAWKFRALRTFALWIPLLSIIAPAIVAHSFAADATPSASDTIIDRVYLPQGLTDATQSYIRFFNLSGVGTSIRANFVDTNAGTSVSTATVSVANNASVQLSITELLALGGQNDVSRFGNGSSLAIYLEANSAPLAVQHVIYSDANGLFENMSV